MAEAVAGLVKHFAFQGAFVVGVIIFKQVFSRRHKKSNPAKGCARYRILSAKDFPASHPRWLVEAARLAEQGVPAECQPPLFPVQSLALVASVQPGLDARRQLFMLDDAYTYLNHGSYGALLRPVAEAQQWYRSRLEAQPVKFMEEEALPALILARNAVADFVGAAWRDVVPVGNATAAINAVVQSLSLRAGDLLLLTTLTYPAVKHTLARAAAACKANLIEVQLHLDTLANPAAILGAYKAALAAGRGRIKLAVVDHVASFPPVAFPVAEICAACKAVGAKVLVDGAHAVGSRPLHLPSLGAHFYTSNLHKWLCTPKGTALLWVDPAEQAMLRPLVTSHGYQLGFQGEFLWPGTTDLTGWLAVPAALAVYCALSPQTVWQHNHGLLCAAVAELQAAWGTRQCVGLQDAYASMAAVELPRLAHYVPSIQAALAVHDTLRRDYHIEVPVAFWDDRMWVRISAHLYNVLADYQKLAECILTIQRKS